MRESGRDKDDSEEFSSFSWIPPENSELVIGLVGPTGSNFDFVISSLSRHFKSRQYKAKLIKLSSLLNDFSDTFIGRPIRDDNILYRIWDLMNVGNASRHRLENGGAVALQAMREIWNYRYEVNKSSFKPAEKTVYILDSLKHEGEIEILRRVYGKAVIILSLFTPEGKRIENLAKRISQAQGVFLEDSKLRDSIYYKQAKLLSARDENEKVFRRTKRFWNQVLEWGIEEDYDTIKKLTDVKHVFSDKYGQNVRDAFPLADVFIDSTDLTNADSQISRMVNLLFGHQFITPTVSEHCMAIADTTRYRSLQPGRQVGAAIARANGHVIATGTNEVPQAGGGQYWPSPNSSFSEDHRDHKLAEDLSRKQIDGAIIEVVARLSDANLLSSDFKPLADAYHGGSHIKETSEEIMGLFKTIVDALEGTRISSLIEFFRSTHAEMAALIASGESGLSCVGTTLYCTTFPCHECTRHIIHAGIKEVYYIEPYAKSLALQLHPDSVCMECFHPPCQKVHFRPFTGIGPRMYAKLFRAARRKDDHSGEIVRWRTGRPHLVGQVDSESIIRSEAREISVLGDLFTEQATLESFEGLKEAKPLPANGGGRT